MVHMKCLTFGESEQWLLSSGVRLDEHRNLQFSREHERIMVTMPRSASPLVYLSSQLARWVSADVGRFLWLSHWQTYPPDQLVQFETMRLGCGETRRIIDSPGHLFEHSGEESNAILAGLIFLIMAFNWEAYITAHGRDEFFYLGDEHIVFSSRDPLKVKTVAELMSAFHLRRISNIREAWN